MRTKPCIICKKELESAIGFGPNEGSWETMQPYAGGEVTFHFSYGSTKYDLAIGGTKVKGFVICDECVSVLIEDKNNPDIKTTLYD